MKLLPFLITITGTNYLNEYLNDKALIDRTVVILQQNGFGYENVLRNIPTIETPWMCNPIHPKRKCRNVC